MKSVDEQIQSLGFEVTSIVQGVTISKKGDRYLYHQEDGNLLGLSQEVSSGDFPAIHSPTRIELMIFPIGREQYAISAKTSIGDEAIANVYHLLETVIQSIATSHSR